MSDRRPPARARERAIELVKVGGFSRAAAGAMVGVSGTTVTKWCRAAGVPDDPRPRAHNPAFVERVQQQLAKGQSLAGIGRTLGVRKNIIAGLVYRLRKRRA